MNSSRTKKINQWGRQLLNVQEVEDSHLLQVFYWVMLFGFFLSFESWLSTSPTVISSMGGSDSHICPPYLQNCTQLYFFRFWSPSYGVPLFYALMALSLTISAWGAVHKRWTLALSLMIPALTWKLIYLGAFTYRAGADFEYFHIPELIIFLFARRKVYFLRLTFAVVYFLAAPMKFSESWIVGNYFTSSKGGMPLVSNAWVPLFSNGVALFEVIVPWLLLSRRRSLRHFAVAAWTLFHLYSITLVQFKYPMYCLPPLWTLFLPDPEAEKTSFRLADSWGWATIAILFIVSAVPQMHSRDWLYTLTAKKFGLAMFIANYQCLSQETIYLSNGQVVDNSNGSIAAMKRCEAYNISQILQNRCRQGDVERIKWRLLSSINGGPFYEIVSTENACALQYKAFAHNDWLRGPSDGAPQVGYPGKNILVKGTPLIAKPHIFPTQQIFLSPVQASLMAELPWLVDFYWCLWFLAPVIFICYRRYRPMSAN